MVNNLFGYRHFPKFLYRALLLIEINRVYKWPRRSIPLKGEITLSAIGKNRIKYEYRIFFKLDIKS